MYQANLDTIISFHVFSFIDRSWRFSLLFAFLILPLWLFMCYSFIPLFRVLLVLLYVTDLQLHRGLRISPLPSDELLYNVSNEKHCPLLCFTKLMQVWLHSKYCGLLLIFCSFRVIQHHRIRLPP